MAIRINEDLLKRLNKHCKETSFKTLDELAEYILEKYLNDYKNENKTPITSDKINQRLKDLGYL